MAQSAETGMWTMTDGTEIHISKMTKSHLYAAVNIAQRAANISMIQCEADQWHEWVDLLREEADSRPWDEPKARRK